MIRRLAAALLWMPAYISAQTAPEVSDHHTPLPQCAEPRAGLCYEFTSDAEGWHVPSWATSADYVHPSGLGIHRAAGQDGTLRIKVDFLRDRWSAVALELSRIPDLIKYDTLAARIRLAQGAGDIAVRWAVIARHPPTWYETPDSIPLTTGQWTDVSVPLERLRPALQPTNGVVLRLESSGPRPADEAIVIDIDFVRFLTSTDGSGGADAAEPSIDPARLPLQRHPPGA